MFALLKQVEKEFSLLIFQVIMKLILQHKGTNERENYFISSK